MKNNKKALISIVTPTDGKDSLFNLIESISKQGVPVNHILLWDDKRADRFLNADEKGNILTPDKIDKSEQYWRDYSYSMNNIVIKGSFIQGEAAGSALRSVGLMTANTDFVTFADDDVMWEDDHLLSMLEAIDGKNWAFCKRKIWNKLDSGEYEYLGIDEFESVGEEAKTPYKMVDNNCMMFHRRFGVSAAPLFRSTTQYNDDRLFYAFLKQYAGIPGKTNKETINQVCPTKLIEFFRKNCTING